MARKGHHTNLLKPYHYCDTFLWCWRRPLYLGPVGLYHENHGEERHHVNQNRPHPSLLRDLPVMLTPSSSSWSSTSMVGAATTRTMARQEQQAGRMLPRHQAGGDCAMRDTTHYNYPPDHPLQQPRRLTSLLISITSFKYLDVLHLKRCSLMFLRTMRFVFMKL